MAETGQERDSRRMSRLDSGEAGFDETVAALSDESIFVRATAVAALARSLDARATAALGSFARSPAGTVQFLGVVRLKWHVTAALRARGKPEDLTEADLVVEGMDREERGEFLRWSAYG